MQVQIETEPKGYEPKTLKITFETEEEYSMFIDTIMYDISVPELVYTHEPSKQRKLQQMMIKIQRALFKGWA